MHMLLSEHTALMVLCARLYFSNGMTPCSSGILSDQTSCNTSVCELLVNYPEGGSCQQDVPNWVILKYSLATSSRVTFFSVCENFWVVSL